MISFVAIDVETANLDRSSLCQIGLAKFQDGNLIDEWETLINPEMAFEETNFTVHKITEEDIENAPTFPEIADEMFEFIGGSLLVHHTIFDKQAIEGVCERYAIPMIDNFWLDSAKVARRTWPECAYRNYGLKPVCEIIGYKFKHHNALEDAKASGKILLAAIEKTGVALKDWPRKAEMPIKDSGPEFRDAGSKKKSPSYIYGDPNGPMAGKILVFTGELSISRERATQMALEAGFDVGKNLTKKTRILVKGDYVQKTSKMEYAERLTALSGRLKIIDEKEFEEMCGK